MYYIYYEPNYYIHNKGKIILFQTPEEAMNFIQQFIGYSANRAVREGKNPLNVIMAQNAMQIKEFHAKEFETASCGFINFSDLIKR